MMRRSTGAAIDFTDPAKAQKAQEIYRQIGELAQEKGHKPEKRKKK